MTGMVHRLSRFAMPIVCACALLVPATAAAVTVGISDEGSSMFTNPLFTRLNLTVARAGIDWNAAVLADPTALDNARAWINAALAAGVKPLVSFQADQGPPGNYIPSAQVYTR